MPTITVDVTHDDIKNGAPLRSAGCMLALALRRTLGRTAWIGSTHFTYFVNGFPADVRLPEVAYLARYNFDAGKPVAPFTFEVEVPE